MSRDKLYADYLNIPSEVIMFFVETFELYEVRARVGQIDGIKFVVKSNETNHALPHIHASYGEYEVSIQISDAEILAGNIPRKQMKKAQEWVIKNHDKLISNWSTLSISSNIPMMRSNL